MQIFPAIDLQGGHCVRLQKGKFDESTTYETDPVKQAIAFAKAGATWLHIVDLDGAKDAKVAQLPVISEIIRATGMRVQVGGGIRSDYDIKKYLDAGAYRVIIGSLAATSPETVTDWLNKYSGDQIILAFDVRVSSGGIPEVLTKGWQEGSAQSLWSVLDYYRDTPLQTILCTDVSRDGMLEGSNLNLYEQIRQYWSSLDIIASGGVSDMDDLDNLIERGVNKAIVGKAIYEKRIDLKEALAKYNKNVST